MLKDGLTESPIGPKSAGQAVVDDILSVPIPIPPKTAGVVAAFRPETNADSVLIPTEPLTYTTNACPPSPTEILLFVAVGSDPIPSLSA